VANAVLLGAHGVFLRDPRPVLLLLALLDGLTALLLSAHWGRSLALGRAGLGLLMVGLQLRSGAEPLQAFVQGVLSLSVGALAARPIRGRAWVATAAGPALYAVAWLAMLAFLAIASAHAQHAYLRLTGQLGAQSLTRLEGRSEPYTLPLPGGPWFPSSEEALRQREPKPEAALFNPTLGAEVAVFVERVPGLGRASPEVREARLRFEVDRALPGFSVLSLRELPGPWDEGRLVRLEGRGPGGPQQVVLARYLWGDRSFLLEARVPAWRFHDGSRPLEALVSAFQFEPPPRPFLPPDVARRVKQATVLLQTPYGTGSGFVVESKHVYSILTNRHVLQAPPGAAPFKVRVLFPGEEHGERTAEVSDVLVGRDVALLWMRVVGKPVPALSMRATLPADGTPVVASGFPLGLEFQLGDTHPEPTLSSGTVLQACARPPGSIQTRCLIQADLGLNPGNSGGPVVDLDGAVVGMATAGFAGSDTGLLLPTETLLELAHQRRLLFQKAPGPSPQRPPEPPRYSTSVRDALRAATVAVRGKAGTEVGVVLEVPGHAGVLILSAAGEERAGERVEVDFFPPGTQAPVTRPATLRHTERDTGLALLEVEPFPERPPGVPLGLTSARQETETLLLGGLRSGAGGLAPMERYAVLTGVELARRWEHGPQAPARLRVDAGSGHAPRSGPAVDREGALAGFVIRSARETDITLLVTPEHLRELLAGRLRAVAARAWRDDTGSCQLEFFVDTERPLAWPRTVSFAQDVPEASLEDDALAPRFGASETLGTLLGRNSTFRLVRPACPEGSLTYRLQLTSSLTTQSVEGILPLPAHPLERTQRAVPLLPLEDVPRPEASDFLRWSDTGAREEPPPTVERALAGCGTSVQACAPVVELALGPARQGVQQALLRACHEEGRAPACVGLAQVLTRIEHTPKGRLPPAQALDALARGCEGGLAEACTRWGAPLVEDTGRNRERGVEALRKACLLGSAQGCLRLAQAHRLGQGVPPNLTLALRMDRRACRLNDASGCLNAGWAHQHANRFQLGEVGPAHEAFRRACLLGSPQGCQELSQAGSDTEP
jgi:S1-C subfamily serine protease